MLGMIRVFAGLAWVVLATAPVAAQTPADSLAGLLREAKTRRWIVRVTADTAITHQGIITALTDSSLIVADRPLKIDEISALERRMSSRSSLKAGAIVGGLIGAGLGGLGAAFGCSMDESNDDCTDEAIVIVTLTAGIGAGMGGLFAGFLGRSEWRPVWRR